MKWVVLLSIFAAFACANAKTGFGPGEQEWDYVTVREGAHMFWWLYYTTADVSDPTERPIIIWLQGGPGGSSTGYGNFEILGALDLDLNPRNYTWVQNFNLLLIDNPVGTGYSYVEKSNQYATDNKIVANDLVNLMRGFYNKLPQFKKTPVYIFGQSYGGKMAIDFGLQMFKEQKAGTIEANVSGVAMGNSWLSAVDSTLSWGPFLYESGLVDIDGLQRINAAADKTKQLFDAGEYYQATVQWANTEYVVLTETDGVDFYNILNKRSTSFRDKSPEEVAFNMHTFSRFLNKKTWDLDELMNGPVKEALGIPSNVRWGSQSGAVFNAMYVDFMKPVTSVIAEVLNTTTLKVFVYNGNVDLICNTPGQKMWVERLRWINEASYRSAKRTTISVNGAREGYRKFGGGFGFHWITVAGHSSPADNPAGLREVLKYMTGV